MLILRQYAPLVFLNARVLSNGMKRLALGREGLRVVVLDATASSGIDSTAAEAFREAREELAAAGVELWVVNARDGGLEGGGGRPERGGRHHPADVRVAGGRGGALRARELRPRRGRARPAKTGEKGDAPGTGPARRDRLARGQWLALPPASSSVRITASRLNEAGFCRGGNFLKLSIWPATYPCIRYMR